MKSLLDGIKLLSWTYLSLWISEADFLVFQETHFRILIMLKSLSICSGRRELKIGSFFVFLSFILAFLSFSLLRMEYYLLFKLSTSSIKED